MTGRFTPRERADLARYGLACAGGALVLMVLIHYGLRALAALFCGGEGS